MRNRLEALNLSRLDMMVGLTVVGIVIAIGLTVLVGDAVGVQIVAASPVDEGRSGQSISIQFSEPMDAQTVESRLMIDPAIDGTFSWSEVTMNFRPAQALTPGETYTVNLPAGAQSDSGRELLSDYAYSFTVRQPRVAFLAPATGGTPLNIWIAEVDNPDSARQVTFSLVGIFDFSVSPDGSTIAFSERDRQTQSADIYLLNLETNETRRVTNCIDSDCTTPIWRPDGNVIAYERVDYNSPLLSVGVSPSRIWLLDLSTSPPSTQPLFTETQLLGYGARWSADGTRIALYESSAPGIAIYDFTDESIDLVPSNQGNPGDLSPDGRYLVFPDLLLEGGGARSYLRIADLEAQEIEVLTAPEDFIDDDMPLFSPDGRSLVIARRYIDDRFTRGRQIYLMDMETREVTPLVVDERYANGFFSWSPTGRQLLIQRFPELDASGQPSSDASVEIWVYDLDSRLLVQVAANAFHPRWAP